MNYYAIIVAGGTGSRMQDAVPKQFLLLEGRPLLMHSIETFFHSDIQPAIILVLNSAHIEQWKELCISYDFKIPHRIADGGETRYHSVKNGLKFVNKNSITAIHDGARPLVSASLITECYRTAEQNGNAIPAVQSSDSIRQLRDNTSIALNRKEIYRIQTPQTFKSEILLNAYEQPYASNFSDDATVVEKSGNNIYIIQGESSNIKITYPEDLFIADALLKRLNNNKRP